MRTILLTILCLNLLQVKAQIIFERSFSKNNSGAIYSLTRTVDNGSVGAGQCTGSGIDTDLFLVKTKDAGDTLWMKSFGGSSNDVATSVRQTSDNGFIVCGYSNSFTENGDYDVYVLRIDSTGTLLWSLTYGGNQIDQAYSVDQTADGGFIVAGKTFSYGAGGSDMYVLRLSPNGNVIWTKTFGTGSDDEAKAIGKTSDGAYFLAGTTRTSSSDSTNICLIKIEDTGSTLWKKIYGGTENDIVKSAQQTSDGGYVIAGSTFSFGSANEDAYVIKTDAVGVVSWSHIYGSYATETGNSVKQTSDNGYIIAGQSSSFGDSTNVYLIRLDSTGSTLWTRAIGGSRNEIGYDVLQNNDGGFLVAGVTNNHSGNNDAYLVKTLTNGLTSCFNKSIPMITSAVSTQTIASFNFESDYYPVDIYFPVTYTGFGGSTYIGCYDNTATSSFTSEAVAVIESNDSIVSEGAVMKNNQFVQTAAPKFSFEVFPNPAVDEVNISMNAVASGEEIRVMVYDAMGRENYSKILVAENESSNVFAMDLSGQLSPGAYMIIASSKNGNCSKILIIK